MGKGSRKAKSQRSDRLFAEFEQAVSKLARTSKQNSAQAPPRGPNPTTGPGREMSDE